MKCRAFIISYLNSNFLLLLIEKIVILSALEEGGFMCDINNHIIWCYAHVLFCNLQISYFVSECVVYLCIIHQSKNICA